MIKKGLPKLPRKKALLRKFPSFNPRNKRFLAVAVIVIILLSAAFFIRAVISSNFIKVTLDNIHCVSQNDLEILANSDKINLFLQDQALTGKLKRKYSCIENIHKQWKPLSLELQVSGRKPVLSIRGVKKTLIMPSLAPSEATSSTQAAAPKPSPSVVFEYAESFWVDETGLVFSKRETANRVPEVDWIGEEVGIGHLLSGDYIRKIADFAGYLNKQSIPYDVLVVENDSLTVKSKEEFIFSLRGDYTTQVTSLQLIVQKAKMNSKSIQKVDLRFNKPVVVYTPEKKN